MRGSFFYKFLLQRAYKPPLIVSFASQCICTGVPAILPMHYLCFMNKLLQLFSVLLVLVSCKQPNKLIKERIADSDSLAINYFKGDGTMDTVVAVKIIRNKQIIQQLTEFISEEKKEINYACGLDGSLHFFKMNKVVQDIHFGMSAAGCRYFSFVLDGKPKATDLSPAAKELIASLRK